MYNSFNAYSKVFMNLLNIKRNFNPNSSYLPKEIQEVVAELELEPKFM